MTNGSVVPETSFVTEAEFRAAMLAGLSRCANSPTKKRALAASMDLSTKGLDNVLLKGAMPSAKRLWDARGTCSTALDDIAAAYGARIVPKESVCDTDHGTLPIAGLLAQVARAESPESPGGTAKTHQELLAMEADIRAVRQLLDGWIEDIDRIRAPRIVATG